MFVLGVHVEWSSTSCENVNFFFFLRRARTPTVSLAGVATNCNVAEAKNKEQKSSAPSTSGRDNALHMWCTTNDSQALKSVADGVQWSARGWNGREWVERTITGGDLCRRTLQKVFKLLPLAPAQSDDVGGRGGRPSGFVQWDAILVGTEAPGSTVGGTTVWQSVVAETLPTAVQLLALYNEKLGCGRNESEPPCDSDACAFCWRGRPDLYNGVVTCFNHWGGAPRDASAGTGTLRGGLVKDAGELSATWMAQETSRANDVEIYVDADARRSGERGQKATTLGRIAYFFEHQGNHRRQLVDGEIQEGEWTVWVAVQEFVTAGRGQARKVDTATGCDMFVLRKSFTLFPASCIRSMVHMVHACSSNGVSSCGLVREEGQHDVWRCTTSEPRRYLLNRYFHSFGREPIA